MRFLHTSDWHLGAMEGTISLKDDQYSFIDEICNLIEQERIDAVLLAGDVYDRSVSSAEAIRIYDYAMTEICGRLHRKVLTIAGNHDSAERLSSCGELLELAGLHVAGALERAPRVISFEDTEVFLLPWITEEKTKSVFPERKDEIHSLEDAYQIVTDQMRASFTPGKRHIVVSHAFITNSETSTSDRAAEIGLATQVSGRVFQGFDYVALGHIHKPQDVNEYIRYSGTPMPYSFGKEETQEKSVTILDTETMERTICPLKQLHLRRTLKGTYEELMQGDQPEDILNGYIRLQVTDSYVGLETLSELRKVYPNLLDVVGKGFEEEGGSVTMSMEEFERLESDPAEIFRQFCREIMNREPEEHEMDLFQQAVATAEEGEA